MADHLNRIAAALVLGWMHVALDHVPLYEGAIVVGLASLPGQYFNPKRISRWVDGNDDPFAQGSSRSKQVVALSPSSEIETVDASSLGTNFDTSFVYTDTLSGSIAEETTGAQRSPSPLSPNVPPQAIFQLGKEPTSASLCPAASLLSSLEPPSDLAQSHLINKDSNLMLVLLCTALIGFGCLLGICTVYVRQLLIKTKMVSSGTAMDRTELGVSAVKTTCTLEPSSPVELGASEIHNVAVEPSLPVLLTSEIQAIELRPSTLINPSTLIKPSMFESQPIKVKRPTPANPPLSKMLAAENNPTADSHIHRTTPSLGTTARPKPSYTSSSTQTDPVALVLIGKIIIGVEPSAFSPPANQRINVSWSDLQQAFSLSPVNPDNTPIPLDELQARFTIPADPKPDLLRFAWPYHYSPPSEGIPTPESFAYPPLPEPSRHVKMNGTYKDRRGKPITAEKKLQLDRESWEKQNLRRRFRSVRDYEQSAWGPGPATISQGEIEHLFGLDSAEDKALHKTSQGKKKFAGLTAEEREAAEMARVEKRRMQKQRPVVRLPPRPEADNELAYHQADDYKIEDGYLDHLPKKESQETVIERRDSVLKKESQETAIERREDFNSLPTKGSQETAIERRADLNSLPKKGSQETAIERRDSVLKKESQETAIERREDFNSLPKKELQETAIKRREDLAYPEAYAAQLRNDDNFFNGDEGEL